MEKLGANPLKVLHADRSTNIAPSSTPGTWLRATIDVADVYAKEGRAGTMHFVVLQNDRQQPGG